MATTINSALSFVTKVASTVPLVKTAADASLAVTDTLRSFGANSARFASFDNGARSLSFYTMPFFIWSSVISLRNHASILFSKKNVLYQPSKPIAGLKSAGYFLMGVGSSVETIQGVADRHIPKLALPSRAKDVGNASFGVGAALLFGAELLHISSLWIEISKTKGSIDNYRQLSQSRANHGVQSKDKDDRKMDNMALQTKDNLAKSNPGVLTEEEDRDFKTQKRMLKQLQSHMTISAFIAAQAFVFALAQGAYFVAKYTERLNTPALHITARATSIVLPLIARLVSPDAVLQAPVTLAGRVGTA